MLRGIIESRGRRLASTLTLALALTTLVTATSLRAQQALQTGEVLPMGDWVEFREVRFDGKPILVHLRIGYERAVIMPEPVRIKSGNDLPGTEVVVENEVVGFYPTKVFKRRAIGFIGLDTGTFYELRVRASPLGFRQPLQLIR